MERTEALNLFEIYKLEKKYGRNIYPEELRGHGILSGSRIPELIERLTNEGALCEENVQGANTYGVTIFGRSQMEAYPDIRREIALI